MNFKMETDSEGDLLNPHKGHKVRLMKFLKVKSCLIYDYGIIALINKPLMISSQLHQNRINYDSFCLYFCLNFFYKED